MQKHDGRMKRKLNITLKVISSMMISIAVVLAVLLVGVRIFGIQVMAILSPSMEPQYPTGSAIYVVDVDPTDLKVNDVITFKVSDSMTATHRIIEIVLDEDDPDVVRFRTKGDSNNTADGPLVEVDDVVGRPVFCIPFLGQLAMYIQSPPGTYVTIGVGVAMFLFVMIADTVTEDKKDTKNKSDKGALNHEEI